MGNRDVAVVVVLLTERHQVLDNMETTLTAINDVVQDRTFAESPTEAAVSLVAFVYRFAHSLRNVIHPDAADMPCSDRQLSSTRRHGEVPGTVGRIHRSK